MSGTPGPPPRRKGIPCVAGIQYWTLDPYRSPMRGHVARSRAYEGWSRSTNGPCLRGIAIRAITRSCPALRAALARHVARRDRQRQRRGERSRSRAGMTGGPPPCDRLRESSLRRRTWLILRIPRDDTRRQFGTSGAGRIRCMNVRRASISSPRGGSPSFVSAGVWSPCGNRA